MLEKIPAEAQADSQMVGIRLRQRRQIRGLTLLEIAEKSGLSVGLLSQIERGITAPSLRSLRQVCAALEMPMGWLFETPDDAESGVIVRANARRRMDLGPHVMMKELMTPDAVTEIQMMRITMEPGSSSGDAPYNNPRGAKCGTVIAGQLGLEVNGQSYLAGPGDSFAFRAEEMHRFWCVGERPVDLLWVVTPALY